MKLIIISAMLVMSVGAFASKELGQNSESPSHNTTCTGCEQARLAKLNQDEQRKSLSDTKKKASSKQSSSSSQ